MRRKVNGEILTAKICLSKSSFSRAILTTHFRYMGWCCCRISLIIWLLRQQDFRLGRPAGYVWTVNVNKFGGKQVSGPRQTWSASSTKVKMWMKWKFQSQKILIRPLIHNAFQNMTLVFAAMIVEEDSFSVQDWDNGSSWPFNGFGVLH